MSAGPGILLVNLGTPAAPRTGEVRRYLREFLSDPRVLDISAWKRRLVLELFILPFRPRSSAEAYRRIWTDEGSPILVHGRELAARLAEALGGAVPVELAMRYQGPSIREGLARLRAAGADRIIVLPLFPQRSSAAWGSAVAAVYEEAARIWNVPALDVVPPFYHHPAFLGAVAAVARPVLAALRPEVVVMSFHGLPERQVLRGDESGGAHCLRSPGCCDRIGAENRNCYRAQCLATARGLAGLLGLGPGSWEVAFQSRLGRERWLRPYLDGLLRDLARRGVKRVAVLSPAFVADCLETLEEIGIRAREDFLSRGGEALRLVPSLNSEEVWVAALVRILGDAGVAPGRVTRSRMPSS